MPNQEILRRDELSGIESMLGLAQLRWSGQVIKMDDTRPPQKLFHAELSAGERHIGAQRKRYKDVLKCALNSCNIPAADGKY